MSDVTPRVGQDEPRPNDRVRVSFEDTVREDGKYSGWRRVLDGNATVEVLERAGDPFKDLEGTIRREDHDGGFSLWQSTLTAQLRSRWLCTYSTSYGNRGEYLNHDDVVGMPVVGSAPGTPADEAARVAVEHTDQFPPEYPEVSGAGVPFPAPRVFSSDGPEPPADVACLEWINGPVEAYRFLKRAGLGTWAWARSAGAHVQPDYPGGTWGSLSRGTPREYLAVLS